ncbi:MAG: class B sortase [Anaerovoracaceae bacterium]
MRKLYRVLMLICLAVFVFSLVKLIGIRLEYKQEEDFYDSAASQYTSQNTWKKLNGDEGAEGPPISVDFSELLTINEDIIGWIYMDDTVVSYPLLQGENNYYYLDKTYYGNYLASGSIYLDTGNDRQFGDAHSIIYGHNMKNHTMFGDMDDFMDADYLKEHPYVDILLTDGTWLRYKIFSVYRADVDDGTFEVPLNGEEVFNEFLQVAEEKNLHRESGLQLPKVDAEDKVITLSTCTEDSSELERFVVTAVLMRVDGKPLIK